MSENPQVPELEVEIPTAGGLKVTGDSMPYRILIVSDLAGSAQGTVSGALREGVAEVDAGSFDALMSAASPSISWKSTHPLLPGNVMVELPLRFDSLRSFEPAALTEQIPAASHLMSIREQLVSRMRGKISAEQLKAGAAKAAADAELTWLPESLSWAPSSAAPASPDAVDSLLGQLDLQDSGSESAVPPPRTGLGALVAAAAGGTSIPAEEASAIRRTIAEVDRRVSSWLTSVLHSPPVQAIEAAWRSLAFVVSHVDFRKGLRLCVLHAHRDELAERFRTRLIDPVFDEGADAPDLIVVDSQFGITAPDMEALDELAQHGASLPAVVVAGIGPGFFGVKQGWQVPTLPAFLNMFDQYQFAKWKTLRSQLYARSLGVVFGRCLLRPPHRREEAGDLEFNYREEAITDADMVWAGGSVAAACSVAQSVADTGWPTAMAGHVHGRVEGFHTAQGGKKGEKKFGPVDVPMPQPKIEELAVAGINAVGGLRDIEDAIFWNGLTAARPAKADHIAFLEVSLPYQLFAARLSVLLLALKPHLAGMGAERIVPFVTTHVCCWLGLTAATPDQVLVQTRHPEDDPAATELAVTVAPPDRVLPGGIPVVLGYRLS